MLPTPTAVNNSGVAGFPGGRVGGTEPKFVMLPALTEKVGGPAEFGTTENLRAEVVLPPVWTATGRPDGGEALAMSLEEIVAAS